MSTEKDLWDHGPRTVCVAFSLLLVGVLLPARAAQADLIWRDHYSDEQAVTNGEVLTASNGVDVTIGTSVFSDNDGGTFDLDPYNNSDYITYERQRLGNVRRHLEISMNNQNNDPADYVELTLTFDSAVTNLEFTLLDIDSGSWDDGVEVFYNGTNNARDNAGITVIDSAYNGIDNETYMHGWEGYGANASNNQTFGNISFDFGNVVLTSLTFRHFSTDDAASNPGGQVAGLSDVTFTEAVPEPRSIACCLLFGLMFCGAQYRRHLVNRRHRLLGACQDSPMPYPVMRAGEVSVRTHCHAERPRQNVA